MKFGHIASPSVDELVALAKMGVRANAFGKTMRGGGVQASELVDSDVQSTGFFSALSRGVLAIKAKSMTRSREETQPITRKMEGGHRVFSAYAKGVDSLPAVAGLTPGGRSAILARSGLNADRGQPNPL